MAVEIGYSNRYNEKVVVIGMGMSMLILILMPGNNDLNGNGNTTTDANTDSNTKTHSNTNTNTNTNTKTNTNTITGNRTNTNTGSEYPSLRQASLDALLASPEDSWTWQTLRHAARADRLVQRPDLLAKISSVTCLLLEQRLPSAPPKGAPGASPARA